MQKKGAKKFTPLAHDKIVEVTEVCGKEDAIARISLQKSRGPCLVNIQDDLREAMKNAEIKQG